MPQRQSTLLTEADYAWTLQQFPFRFMLDSLFDEAYAHGGSPVRAIAHVPACVTHAVLSDRGCALQRIWPDQGRFGSAWPG